jgi:lipopolysaccharide export system permease protein
MAFKRQGDVRIINRYLFNAIAGTTLLIMMVFLSLGGFVEFISQLDDIGQGDYNLIRAIQYVLLKLPRIAIGLLPACVLLGALLGLGALANNSELIVMQAAGVSFNRMAQSVALTGLTIAIVGGVIGEFIAPQMDLYARQMRAVAKSGSADMAGSSAWLRNGNTIFNVRPSIDGIDYGGVYVFRMGEPGRLTGIGRADSVQEDSDEWALSNYRESLLGSDNIEISTDFDVEEIVELSDLLTITAVRESSLTGTELWAYVQHLKSNGLDAERYEIAFWSRVATLAGIAVMCMLALPFVFGSLRTTGSGARMLIGVLIGVGYFLLSRTLADSAAVFNLSPVLVAWIPTVLLATGTLIGLNRLR